MTKFYPKTRDFRKTTLYKCECDNGFEKNSHNKCEDVNECDKKHFKFKVCDSQNCVNTIGSFYCEPINCPAGLEADYEKNCVDIDECEEDSTVCAVGEVCENTVGSYICRKTAAPTTEALTTTAGMTSEATKGTSETPENEKNWPKLTKPVTTRWFS